MRGQPGHNPQLHAWPIAAQFPGHGWMHRLTTDRSFDHKLRGSLMFLAYFSDMLPTGLCKTEHWHTSGRLVRELNVWTVAWITGEQEIVIQPITNADTHYLKMSSLAKRQSDYIDGIHFGTVYQRNVDLIFILKTYFNMLGK